MPDDVRGGIGNRPVNDQRVDLADSLAGEDAGDETPRGVEAPVDLGERRATLATVVRTADALKEAQEMIEQLRGQNAQIESYLGQFQQALLQQGARIDALGKALAQNYRVEACRIAAGARQPAEQSDRTIELARKLHKFMVEEPDAVDVLASQEPQPQNRPH